MEFILQLISELFISNEEVENVIELDEDNIGVVEEEEVENIFGIMNFH